MPKIVSKKTNHSWNLSSNKKMSLDEDIKQILRSLRDKSTTEKSTDRDGGVLNSSAKYSSFGVGSRVSQHKSPISSRVKRDSVEKTKPSAQKPMDFWDSVLNKSFHKVRKDPFQLSAYRKSGAKRAKQSGPSKTIEKGLKTSLDTLPYSKNYISGNRRTRKMFENALPCKKSRRVRMHTRFQISTNSKLARSAKSGRKGARRKTPVQAKRGKSSNVRRKENLEAQNRLSLVGPGNRPTRRKRVVGSQMDRRKVAIVTRRAKQFGRVSVKKD